MSQTETLSRLQAEAAIRELIAAYSQWVDAGDMVRCAELFTREGVVLVVGKERTGRAEILAWLEATAAMSAGRAGRHFVSNTRIVVESATSLTARSDMIYVGAGPGEPWQVVAVGGYQDHFIQEDGAWRIRERKIDFLAKPSAA